VRWRAVGHLAQRRARLEQLVAGGAHLHGRLPDLVCAELAG